MSGAHWSLGTIIWLPIAGLLFLIGAGLAVWLFRLWRRERARNVSSYDDLAPFYLAGAIGCVAGLVALTFGVAWGEYPYNSEYHQWRDTSGVVQAVGSRLLAQDHGTTQRFVVTLSGVGQRACDDTRCSEVKVGDRLTLSCKRAWQYAGSDGYDCNFVSLRAGAR